MKVSNKVSNGFQIANLICTVLVISIHYNSKYHIPPSEFGEWNYIFQEYFTNGIARIAVPFFSLSAGIFFYLNYTDINYYFKSIKKRIKTLLIPYLIGCSIILLSYYLLKAWKGELANQYYFEFFVKGYLHPASVQYWFLRDLMILLIISPIIFQINSVSRGLSTLIFGIFWMLEIALTPRFIGWYLINIETLFFFSLGCYIVTSNERWYKFFEMSGKKIIVVLILSFLTMMALRVYFAPTFNNWKLTGYNTSELILHKTAILIGTYSVISFSCEIKSKKILYISSFTFFAYLYHLFPFSKIITKIGNYIISDDYLFYFTFPFATITIFSLAMLLNRYFSSFYNFLSGARSPNKVINRTI